MKIQYDFKKINSLTKYPSILTYHKLGQKGKLEDELIETSAFGKDERLNVYEKIDGENSRIIFLCDGLNVDYLIGSRENLLFAKGDRIGDPSGNIASYFEPIADDISEKLRGFHGLFVTYFESYGGKTSNSKQYTDDHTQYGRMFDVFSLNETVLDEMLSKPIKDISLWRDHGKQPYFNCDSRNEFAKMYGIPTSPLLANLNGLEMPTDIKTTYEWLQQFKDTKVGINSNGKSEGVVIRTQDRKKIAKIRFEDYERTLRNK